MSKVKVGVVGVGRMGTYHVGVLAELPDVELAAVVDTDPKNLLAIEKNYGTPGFNKHQDLYGKVEVAVVAVPTGLHYPITKDLLSAPPQPPPPTPAPRHALPPPPTQRAPPPRAREARGGAEGRSRGGPHP